MFRRDGERHASAVASSSPTAHPGALLEPFPFGILPTQDVGGRHGGWFEGDQMLQRVIA
jgi:hypothetical protein